MTSTLGTVGCGGNRQCGRKAIAILDTISSHDVARAGCISLRLAAFEGSSLSVSTSQTCPCRDFKDASLMLTVSRRLVAMRGLKTVPLGIPERLLTRDRSDPPLSVQSYSSRASVIFSVIPNCSASCKCLNELIGEAGPSLAY